MLGSNFKIFSVLTLVSLFRFVTIHSKCMCKSQIILEILGALRKKQ